MNHAGMAACRCHGPENVAFSQFLYQTGSRQIICKENSKNVFCSVLSLNEAGSAPIQQVRSASNLIESTLSSHQLLLLKIKSF